MEREGVVADNSAMRTAKTGESRTATKKEAEDAVRDEVRTLIEQSGLNATSLSKSIGRDKGYISEFLKGKKGSIDASALNAIRSIASARISGPTRLQNVSVTSVHVRGEAAAGRWFEHDEIMDEYPETVPTIPGKFSALEQFAYKIVGPSMDKRRILPGDYVICVPYFDARRDINSGDIVVVERKRGQLIERTCKELQVTDGGFELWPRSTDQRFQEPIRVPNGIDPHADDGTEIEIVGLVIAVHVPV